MKMIFVPIVILLISTTVYSRVFSHCNRTPDEKGYSMYYSANYFGLATYSNPNDYTNIKKAINELNSQQVVTPAYHYFEFHGKHLDEAKDELIKATFEPLELGVVLVITHHDAFTQYWFDFAENDGCRMALKLFADLNK
jgi:hypothetical protein